MVLGGLSGVVFACCEGVVAVVGIMAAAKASGFGALLMVLHS